MFPIYAFLGPPGPGPGMDKVPGIEGMESAREKTITLGTSLFHGPAQITFTSQHLNFGTAHRLLGQASKTITKHIPIYTKIYTDAFKYTPDTYKYDAAGGPAAAWYLICTMCTGNPP